MKLGKEINDLMAGGELRQGNSVSEIMLPDKMMTHLNILGALMKDRIVGNLDHTLIVTKEWHDVVGVKTVH